MLAISRPALAYGFAILLFSQAYVFAQLIASSSAVLTPQADRSPPLHLARKNVIDKSCLMVCEDWGDNGCKKWVMKCKGDPGYPSGVKLNTQ
jgi:hypothetical protein